VHLRFSRTTCIRYLDTAEGFVVWGTGSGSSRVLLNEHIDYGEAIVNTSSGGRQHRRAGASSLSIALPG
jgi:hypothetical protein